jgi:hypothetical protein
MEVELCQCGVEKRLEAGRHRVWCDVGVSAERVDAQLRKDFTGQTFIESYVERSTQQIRQAAIMGMATRNGHSQY